MSSICLPEPLQHDDARSWFKRFELCAPVNEWDAATLPPNTSQRLIVGNLQVIE